MVNYRTMKIQTTLFSVILIHALSIGCSGNTETIIESKEVNIGFRIPIINDHIVYSKNKDGSVSRDKKGRKKYEIKEGVDSLNTPLTLHKLLHCNALC